MLYSSTWLPHQLHTLQALEMVNDIHVAFEEMVHDLDWMDDTTKNLTLQKAHAIRPFVGFPEWLLVPGELERYYHGVKKLTIKIINF